MRIKNSLPRFFKKFSESGATTLEVALFGVLAVLGTFTTIEAGRYFYSQANACNFAENASDKMQSLLERSYANGYYMQSEFLSDVNDLNSWAQNKLASNPRFHMPGAAGRPNDGEAVPVVNSYDTATLNMLSVLRSQEDTSSEWSPGAGGSIEGGGQPDPVMEFGGVSGTVSSSNKWQHPEATTVERHSPITPFYIRFKAKHDPLIFSFLPALKTVSCSVPVSNLPWVPAIMENRWGAECADDLFGIDQRASCEMMSRGSRVCNWSDSGFSIPGWSSCNCYCRNYDNGGTYHGPTGEVPPDSDCSSTGPLAQGCPAGTHWDEAACACVCDAVVCGAGFCPNPTDGCTCEGPIHTPMKACAGETFTWDSEHCWWVSNGWTCPPGSNIAPYPVCCVGGPTDPSGGTSGPSTSGGNTSGPTTSGGILSCGSYSWTDGMGNPQTGTVDQYCANFPGCVAYAYPTCGCHCSGPGPTNGGPTTSGGGGGGVCTKTEAGCQASGPNCHKYSTSCACYGCKQPMSSAVMMMGPEPSTSQACINGGGEVLGTAGESPMATELGMGITATDCDLPMGAPVPSCTPNGPMMNPMTGGPSQTYNCS